jgi:hypothetical protein
LFNGVVWPNSARDASGIEAWAGSISVIGRSWPGKASPDTVDRIVLADGTTAIVKRWTASWKSGTAARTLL